MGILEQEIANIKNPLPGAKKSLPYMTETSASPRGYRIHFLTLSAVVLFWKLIELNKVCFKDVSQTYAQRS